MSEKRVLILSFIGLSAVFLISSYLGYLAAKEDKSVEMMLRKFFEGFRGFMDNPILFTLVIFANNAVKSLVAMLGGFFFGIFPILFIAANGYVLGIVLSLKEPEWGLHGVIMAILPHGVLEIPAVLIACSYGVWLGIRFAYSLFRGDEFKPYLLAALRMYVKVVVPVLLVAAIVEVFITPTFIPQT